MTKTEASAAADPEYDFYKSIKDYEHHFNRLMMDARKIASTWLLLAFGALAFVARGELKDGALLEAVPMISIICLLGAVGLYLLYIVDIIVYRGLLNSAFNMGMRIETRRPEIPPLRSMMMVTARETGMGRYQVWFYRGPMAALALISTVANLGNFAAVQGDLVAPASQVSSAWLLLAIANWLLVAFEKICFERGESRKLAHLVSLGMLSDETPSKGPYAQDGGAELQDVVDRTVETWGRRSQPRGTGGPGV